MTTTLDPFAATPGAVPGDFEIRERAWAKPEKTCELVGRPRRKKRVDLNPVQQRWFTREGYTFARVDAANAWGGMTVDLWGFADYLACRRGEILLVQTTDHTHAAARVKKAKAAPELAAWLAAGGRFAVHAWRQPGGAGSRWEVEVREVTA